MRRLLIAVPLFVALASLGAIALGILRSDRALREVSREMDAWAAARIQPPAAVWSSIRDELKRAERIAPGRPVTHELMGHLAARGPGRKEDHEEARAHLVAALSLRPSSAYAWAGLAEILYKSGDTGPLFEVSLARAAELGPAEPGVQRIVANYGLAVWDDVEAPTRASIDKLIAAGMRRQPAEMLQIAGQRDRLQTACRHLEASPRRPDSKWLQLCERTGAPS